MAPQDPLCSAVASAKEKSGLSYAQIAQRIGNSEQHVIDVCTGKTRPTTAEFDALAKALGITSGVPATTAHATA
ncbi:hypothetical protein BDZ94DRAFT_1315270 [Collybia nuda]|uniref:HTH cro/C1-type domain-containing protein n=1 Tax=Collybia nuda TaxID=64659 RepID=A0A9P6CBR0_9AGAR|nr:hypothetical protein BDZ94DRAFT_1315270 [Collybia nuda]